MFRNRKDAARQLARLLFEYEGQPNTIVAGIPKGGVKSAFHIASALLLPLEVLISRKISLPSNPESAIGAIAEDGSTHLTTSGSDGVSEQRVNRSVEQQKEQIIHYIKKFRNGKSFPALKNKTVLLVDDGAATGATLFAAIQMCRNKGAGKIIAAVPVAGSAIAYQLQQTADKVLVLEQPAYYFAVSQVYGHFPNLTDDRVVDILDKWRHVDKKTT